MNPNDPNQQGQINNQNNYPNWTWTNLNSILSSGTAYAMPNATTVSVNSGEKCKLCGESLELVYLSGFPFNGFCSGCSNKVFEAFWKEYFDKNLKGKKEYCLDCKRHMEACKCKKSEAMRELKK